MTFQIWNPDWFPLRGQAVFDVQHQHVAAVSRNPTQLDLFVIGNDGHPYSTFWNPSGNPAGWRDWFSLPGQAVFDKNTQQIAAVSRGPNNLDLFVIGNDGGHVWTTFWGPHAPISLDASIDQNKTVVPLQLGLQIGATDGIVIETKWSLSKNGAVIPTTVESVAGPPGGPIDRIYGINEPGSYQITVNRTGIVDPGVETTLTKEFQIRAEVAPPPPPPPPTPAPVSPTCSVELDPDAPISDAFVAVRVFGGGFIAKETLRIDLDGNLAEDSQADASGLYVVRFGIPRGNPPAQHKLQTFGVTSGKKSNLAGITT